jgi:Fe-S-cluster containining protein
MEETRMPGEEEKERTIRQIIDNIDWDLWREQYDNLSFDDQRRIYDEILPKFPQQEGYDASFFLRAFRRLADAGFNLSDTKVAELGPFRGELAAICLKQFRVKRWFGYEISRWAVERTRTDAKERGFANFAVRDQFWKLDVSAFNIFISSDTIEHFSDEHAKNILSAACDQADVLMLQIDCKPKGASWKGYNGTHKIEMTIDDVVLYLAGKGFHLVERSGIRLFMVRGVLIHEYPELAEVAPPEKKYVPIQTGFRFECQKCGACCRENWEILPTEEEIARLKEYNIPIHFKKMLKKFPNIKEPQMAIVPVLPKMDGKCFCLGDDKDKNICVIHPFRPTTCFRLPLVIYTYRQRPPLEELRELLDDPTMTEEDADRFIITENFDFGGKKYDVFYVAAAGVFLGSGIKCPGIGKGEEWNDPEVRSFVKRYSGIFEEHAKSVKSTIQKYTDQFKADFDKHFELVDADRQIYQPRKRSWGDIIGA